MKGFNFRGGGVSRNSPWRLQGPGRTHYLRRIDEGDTNAGARRCLKRRISRTIFTRMMADHRALTNAASAPTRQ